MAVIGGGAAGLATAIFTARQNPGLSILVLDSARKLGAKILVSGGGRCNVTNTVVTAADFRGGSPHAIRRVLESLPVEPTTAFFREIGVALHEEDDGKLFPDTHDADTVLSALLREASRLHVDIRAHYCVLDIERIADGFKITTIHGPLRASKVVLATGGLSLPKTGSDGGGYKLAQHLGHTLVPPTPALVPLVLEGDFHRPLSGVSQPAELTVRAEGEKPVRLRGSLLWTHFGVSGPVVMNASGLWHRARLENRSVACTASFLPGITFESLQTRFLTLVRERPTRHLHNALSTPELAGFVTTPLPAGMMRALLQHLNVAADTPLAHLERDSRRRLLHALLEFPLPVRDSRGYNYAEVTSGGVPLIEIDPGTMASRKCPGLFLVGEILDVDGRIGGFNFQWAWSSAFVAAQRLGA